MAPYISGIGISEIRVSLSARKAESLDARVKSKIGLLTRLSFIAGVNISRVDPDAPTCRTAQRAEYEEHLEQRGRNLTPTQRELAQDLTQFAYYEGFASQDPREVNAILKKIGCRRIIRMKDY